MKETKTKSEIVKIHNEIAGHCPGQMMEYATFDQMLPHIRKSWAEKYRIIDDPVLQVINNLHIDVYDEKIINGLAQVYRTDSAYVVAKICDEVLDRSGKLLGLVREKSWTLNREYES